MTVLTLCRNIRISKSDVGSKQIAVGRGDSQIIEELDNVKNMERYISVGGFL